MENLNLLIYTGIVIPLALMAFISRERSRLLLIFFIIGITVALFCGELNSIVFSLVPFNEYYSAGNISPVIEEVFKSVPVVFYTFVYKPKKQAILESAVAVGIGFALMENIVVFVNASGTLTLMTAVFRAFAAGIMHGLSTLSVGFGMSYVNKYKKLAKTGTLGLLSVAIIFHSAYNTLLLAGKNPEAFMLPWLVFIILILLIKTNILHSRENSSIINHQ